MIEYLRRGAAVAGLAALGFVAAWPGPAAGQPRIQVTGGLAGYSEDPAHVEAELRRTELLAAPASETTRPYFLFDDVHEALRRAVREAPRRAADPRELADRAGDHA